MEDLFVLSDAHANETRQINAFSNLTSAAVFLDFVVRFFRPWRFLGGVPCQTNFFVNSGGSALARDERKFTFSNPHAFITVCIIRKKSYLCFSLYRIDARLPKLAIALQLARLLRGYVSDVAPTHAALEPFDAF
jgi:hypothetical protein